MTHLEAETANRRTLSFALLVGGLFALFVLPPSRAEANCSCSPSGSTVCPTNCLCASSQSCCACWTGCGLLPGPDCLSGYTEIDSASCGLLQTQNRCRRCITAQTCIACDSGWFGSTCQFACPGGAANPCNGNGTCSEGMAGTGICTCASGHAGSACQYSDAGTCNGHGVAQSDGSCVCAPGIAGASCNQCSVNYYGYPSCTYCLAGSTCSGNGTCSTANGSCQCESGFGGAACDQCATDYVGYPDCATICGDVDDDGDVDLDDIDAFRFALADPVSASLSRRPQTSARSSRPRECRPATSSTWS